MMVNQLGATSQSLDGSPVALHQAHKPTDVFGDEDAKLVVDLSEVIDVNTVTHLDNNDDDTGTHVTLSQQTANGSRTLLIVRGAEGSPMPNPTSAHPG